MNRLISLLFSVVVFFNISACTSSYSSVTQVEDSAFLVLKGNFTNAKLEVGDQLIDLNTTTKTFEINNTAQAKFPMDVGVHVIKVYRDQELLIKKSILLSNGQSVEVIIP